MIALLYQNRIEEALTLLEERGNKKEEHLQAAFMYRYIHPESNNPFIPLLVDQVDEFEDKLMLDWEGTRLFDWNSKASLYYVSGDFEKAKETLLHMDKAFVYKRIKPYNSFPENKYWEKAWHTAMLGCVYAKLGEYEKAKSQIDLLGQLEGLNQSTISMFYRGTHSYLIGRIYAEMGEKELAVEYLQKSVKQGRPFAYMCYTADMYLLGLKGYPPFEELIRPKG
ncbi:MAG: tetratricopeptide repeat protein [Bacteroidota bacterium]